MTAIVRIALRYLGIFLATKGFIGIQELTGDAEVIALVETALGATIALGTEVWYALAKRYGWKT